MAGEMLSQEEINALLGGIDLESIEMPLEVESNLSEEQIDALGELGNISMGTAATTLFALLNHKVMITTPRVEILTMDELNKLLTEEMITISVDYTEGLMGTNLLLINEKDVKIIADLMMGGVGNYTDEPISEFHLSAIAEAMNQMIGSASTSMSQMFEKKIDISPPHAAQVTDAQMYLEQLMNTEEVVVKVSFRMQILENIIDSELMQVLPLSFAKDLVDNILNKQRGGVSQVNSARDEAKGAKQMESKVYQVEQEMQREVHTQPSMTNQRQVEVGQLQFPNFEKEESIQPVGNMDVLLDVALEVSVELGRTKKKIKEILEFGPGTVIELDRLVGEPIDVLVNGKYIAKGEVVVIDENFGIRITDIIKPENRI